MFGAGPLPAELESDLVVLYDTDPAGFNAVRREVLRQRGLVIAAQGLDAENRVSIAAAMTALLSLARTGWVRANLRDGGSAAAAAIAGAGGGSSGSSDAARSEGKGDWSAKRGHAHTIRSSHSYSRSGGAAADDALPLPHGATSHEEALAAVAAATTATASAATATATASAATATSSSKATATATSAMSAAPTAESWYARALSHLAPYPLLPALPPAIAHSPLCACALLAAALAVALAAVALATGLRLTDSSWLQQPRRGAAVAAASQMLLPTSRAAARRQQAKQQSRLWAWVCGSSCRLHEPLLPATENAEASAAASNGGGGSSSGLRRDVASSTDTLQAADGESRDTFDWPPASVPTALPADHNAHHLPHDSSPAATGVTGPASSTTFINPVAGAFPVHPHVSGGSGGGGVGGGSSFLRIRTTGPATTAATAAATAVAADEPSHAPCSPADSLISWTSLASPTAAAVAAGRLLAPTAHTHHARSSLSQQFRYCPLSPAAGTAPATTAGNVAGGAVASSPYFYNPLLARHPHGHQAGSPLATSTGGAAASGAGAAADLNTAHWAVEDDNSDVCVTPLRRSAVSCIAASGHRRNSHSYSHGTGGPHFATAYFHARDGLSRGLTTAVSPRTPRHSGGAAAGGADSGGTSVGAGSSSGCCGSSGSLVHRRATAAFLLAGGPSAATSGVAPPSCGSPSWAYAAASPAAAARVRFNAPGGAAATAVRATGGTATAGGGGADVSVLLAEVPSSPVATSGPRVLWA